MKVDTDKHFVKSLLENMQFDVELVPEACYKTPDIKLLMPESDVLVEVIAKEDDKQLRDLLDSPSGTILPYNVAPAETKIRDAWRQIRDFPYRDQQDFTLIWFITRKVGGVTVLVKLNIKTLLYGIEIISDQGVERPCYFFNESFFFKYKDLDGVILHEAQLENQLIDLCLNPFSPRYSTFKSMKLTEFFLDRFSVIDPWEMEVAGECFLVDCDIPRQDKDGIVRYLKDKYRLDKVTIHRSMIFNLPVH